MAGSGLLRLAGRWIDPVVRFALPPRCPACGEVVDADNRLCAACWLDLRFLGPPGCASCGVPFDHDRGPAACCGACLADPPVHDGAAAAVAYGDTARTLALKLKYGGRLAVAATMARLMARHVGGVPVVLVPVPLHRWRLWSRGYNQALLIARELGRLTGHPVDGEALVRIRATRALKGLGRIGRRNALRGAFAVRPDARARIAGRDLLLIDDVLTSGATAEGCVRALKRAGAARVRLLCWARVLDDDNSVASAD